jgi:hypothetical protein
MTRPSRSPVAGIAVSPQTDPKGATQGGLFVDKLEQKPPRPGGESASIAITSSPSDWTCASCAFLASPAG